VTQLLFTTYKRSQTVTNFTICKETKWRK